MSFDTQFRKELKSMLSTSGQNHSTSMSDREVKHVSWVSIETDEEPKHKKQPRSTPFPRKKATQDEINIKPVVLSFNDCFDSMEEIESRPKRKRNESTGEYVDFKKTLSKKSVPSGLNSGWVETDVSSPLPRSDSDISSDNIIPSDIIDPSGQLAKEILKKIKDSNIYNDLSTTDESFVEEERDELISFSEVDQIELFNGDCFDSGTSLNECSETSSSDEETVFKVPKIVKNAKRFKKHCQIITANSILDNLQNGNNPEETNSLIQKEEVKQPLVVEYKKPVVKKQNELKTIKFTPSPSLDDKEKMDSVQDEAGSDSDSGSSDTGFLLGEIDENLDVTKDFSFITTDEANKKFNESITESVQYYLSKKHSILFLTHETMLYFCGKLSFTVLSGAIEILGHVFEVDEKEIEVYSPKGQSYLYISNLGQHKNEKLEKILSNYNIKVTVDNLEHTCVLLVKNLENSLTHCLTNLSPKMLFPKVSSNHEKRALSLLEMRLQSYFEIEPSSYWPLLVIDEDWSNFYNSLDFGKKISMMVCGGKSVGKSTFLKFVTNKLLNNFEKVVYIDLDPGQPEFTLSGCISITIVEEPLLGPSYTHLRKPERCYFLGEINISHCFTRYIDAVKDLMCYYRTKIDPTIPCVINYMGFTKSLGTDLIASILPMVSPSILVQIESEHKKHNFPDLLTADLIRKRSNTLPIDKEQIMERKNLNYDLKVLQSVTSRTDRSSVLEPRILRNLSIVAYFSQSLATGCETIAGVTPYCASLSSLTIQHVSETVGDLLPIINGNLVALCTDSSSKCLGFGIIRGIDTTSDKIYIITPETSKVMRKVKTLVMGTITLPSSFYTTIGFHEDISYPYICRTVKRATTGIPKRSYKACQRLLTK